jgi:hypothetical protein
MVFCDIGLLLFSVVKLTLTFWAKAQLMFIMISKSAERSERVPGIIKYSYHINYTRRYV